jgi:hypothetical protein
LIVTCEGDVDTCAAALTAFQKAAQLPSWEPHHLWLYNADPQPGAGNLADAESVLRRYVHAAAAGVGSLVWNELRDDDTDPVHPHNLRGLVRRDFSPRATALGYSATAGLLTGFDHAGAVAKAPAAFDSALFIGGRRQVAILLPRSNRILPAVLAIDQGAPVTSPCRTSPGGRCPCCRLPSRR